MDCEKKKHRLSLTYDKIPIRKYECPADIKESPIDIRSTFIDITTLMNSLNKIENAFMIDDNKSINEIINATVIQLKVPGLLNIKKNIIIKIASEFKKMQINMYKGFYSGAFKNVKNLQYFLEMV
jgi:hypothetical protein